MTAVVSPEIKPARALESSRVWIATADAKLATERAAIDRSISGAVLGFFSTSILWLLASSLLGFIRAYKLHHPGFLADIPCLTYGRIAPVYNLALTYGWASLAGMGVGIWLLARLCKVPVRYPGLLNLGNIFWNLGLLLGIFNVLIGKSTGVEGMEMPFGAAAIMFAGYLLIGTWAAVIYRLRRNAPVYISVWYLLGAFFWFPWFFGVSNLLVGKQQVHGVMTNVIAAWYSQDINLLWLSAIGLATAYYLIPKVINRPIFSYNVASIGFWSFATIGGLTGLVRLSGGPIPAWFVTVGIAANLMMLVPVATVMANFVFTLRGRTDVVNYSPTIRFTFFGAVAFGVASVLSLLTSLRGLDRILHFTQYQVAQQHLFLYAFFSMVMFGAIYYITPRLVGCEWLSATLIKFHFFGAAYGGGLLIVILAISGIAAGSALADPETSFSQVVQVAQSYHIAHTLAFLLTGLAHVIFAFHFGLMLLRIGQPGAEPTLFSVPGEEQH